MNAMIAQLAEQAAQESFDTEHDSALEVSNDEVSYQIPAGFIQRFAELMIGQCGEVLIKEGEAWEQFSRNPPEGQETNAGAALFAAYRLKEDAVSALEEHFGVEP
jgi:hypothetical protein